MYFYFTHNGYVHICELLQPENLIPKINNNENQCIQTMRKFKIMMIETLYGDKSEQSPDYKINEIFSCPYAYYYKTKEAAIFRALTLKVKNKIRNEIVNENYKINMNLIKLIPNGYTGYHKVFYPDGTLEAEFFHINGMIQGLYKEYHRDGKIKLETEFVDNKKNGKCAKYYKNRYHQNIIEKMFYIDDKLNGKLEKTCNGNTFQIKTYVNGKLDGLYEYNNFDYKITCFYKDGKKHGEYKKYVNNQLIKECKYFNGKLHGTYKTYFNPQYPRIIPVLYLHCCVEYINGKRDGFHILYTTTNDMMVTEYENDKIKN